MVQPLVFAFEYCDVNPTARARAELHKALVAAVTGEDIAQVAKALLSKAIDGDVPSAELLLRYVIGRAVPANDPDRLALESWRLVQAWPTLAEYIVANTRGVNPELASDIMSHTAIGDVDKLGKRLMAEEDL